jgi:acyl carrier protein
MADSTGTTIMTRKEILGKLSNIVAAATGSKIDPGAVKGTSRLAQDLGLTSMDLSEILYEAEAAFEVKIDDEEAMTVKTVDDVVNLIEKKLKG